MSKICVSIETDNDAFRQSRKLALVSILRAILQEVIDERGLDGMRLYDFNGNEVGCVREWSDET